MHHFWASISLLFRLSSFQTDNSSKIWGNRLLSNCSNISSILPFGNTLTWLLSECEFNSVSRWFFRKIVIFCQFGWILSSIWNGILLYTFTLRSSFLIEFSCNFYLSDARLILVQSQDHEKVYLNRNRNLGMGDSLSKYCF